MEGDFRIAIITGGGNHTYTPTNSSGKTIRVLNCYHVTGGSAVCTVSAGVITVDTGKIGGTSGEVYHLMYTLT